VTISGKFWNVRELLLPKKLQMWSPMERLTPWQVQDLTVKDETPGDMWYDQHPFFHSEIIDQFTLRPPGLSWRGRK
jgi:hypothetical protein